MEAILTVALIFVLRVINYAIGTIRMVTLARNQRLISSVLAALEALIFAVVIAGVVSDLDNIPNLVAYCLGASVGSWAGLILEHRLIRSYMIVNVFANTDGDQLATSLREAGFGVTSNISQGRDSDVLTIRSVIDKREVKRYVKLVQSINPQAFIATEEARGVQRGWLGVGRSGRHV